VGFIFLRNLSHSTVLFALKSANLLFSAKIVQENIIRD
jgi:hypothetical protein